MNAKNLTTDKPTLPDWRRATLYLLTDRRPRRGGSRPQGQTSERASLGLSPITFF